MKELKKNSIEFQDPKVLFLPLIQVSRWTDNKLCKIQVAKGIALKIWVESELVKLIHRQWNFEENRPRRGPNHE